MKKSKAATASSKRVASKPAPAAGKSKTIKPSKRASTKVPERSDASRALLDEVRSRIDGIDQTIQSLIAERAQKARQVGKAKGAAKAAIDYYRPEREAQVLRRVVDRNEGPLTDEVLVRVFREIMSACLAQQEPLKVGYLGPEGTFSQQAVYKHFGHSAHGLPLTTIEEVFQEVESGAADFGVVPVENSGQGTIQSTLDMFLTSPLKICGEVELRVHQYLLSRTGHIEDVERVYAHAQSLAQCKTWLRQHLPQAEKQSLASNAEAARRARNADDSAAIAGKSAAHVYGLKVIAGPIEDRPDNTTRFLVIGRELFSPSGNDRTSVLVYVKDKPGALFNVLRPLAEHGLSMNRIESRPAHQGLWRYAFFIDFGGHVDDEAVQRALKDIAKDASEIKILGSYPCAIL